MILSIAKTEKALVREMNKKILKFELVDVSFCGIKILSVIYVNISLMLNSFVIFLNI